MAERAAIVTGASSGIGLAIARVLGQEGYGVTMAARRAEKLEGAVAELAGEGLEVHGVAADVSHETEIQKVVAAHRERYGRLDVLVNNAGVGIGAPLGDIQTKRLDMQLDINLRAIVIFYRECLELLQAAGAEHRNALVVNTASIAGKHGAAWTSVYSATKHGVVGWTRSMHIELGQQGIKSTALCPAFVDTPMTDYVKGQVKAEEMIRPEDIAEAAARLPRVHRPGDDVHTARRHAVTLYAETRSRRRTSQRGARRRRATISPAGSAVGSAVRARGRCASSSLCSSIARARSTRSSSIRLARRRPTRTASSCLVAPRHRRAWVKRSQERAKERKLVRPPRRCAASIGHTPPSPSV
jgi:NAD(P)-dependent dehydrogenase (short-subunit alcohol dehydrogenase family)